MDLPSEAALEKICSVVNKKYIPSAMLDGIKKSIATFADPCMATDETRINYTDRYVIYDDDHHFTLDVVKHLVYWIKRYTWDETYRAIMTDEEAEEKMKRRMTILKEVLGLSEEYAEDQHEDSYYMTRYLPNQEHAKRLKWLSERSGVAHHKLIARDMDIRIRKDRFLVPEKSIHTSYGKDYLFFRYANRELKKYEGSIINVGESCIICTREKNIMHCGKCNEAVYCSREHQKEDWKRHKLECSK